MAADLHKWPGVKDRLLAEGHYFPYDMEAHLWNMYCDRWIDKHVRDGRERKSCRAVARSVFFHSRFDELTQSGQPFADASLSQLMKLSGLAEDTVRAAVAKLTAGEDAPLEIIGRPPYHPKPKGGARRGTCYGFRSYPSKLEKLGGTQGENPTHEPPSSGHETPSSEHETPNNPEDARDTNMTINTTNSNAQPRDHEGAAVPHAEAENNGLRDSDHIIHVENSISEEEFRREVYGANHDA